MATGHRHRAHRLAVLLARVGVRAGAGPRGRWREPAYRRAERRQIRKLLGRAWGIEWRSWGNFRLRDGRRAVHVDALNTLIAARAKSLGHVAQKIQGPK